MSDYDVLNWTIKFGKYKGKTFYDVINTDKKYMDWVVNNTTINEKIIDAYKAYCNKNI